MLFKRMVRLLRGVCFRLREQKFKTANHTWRYLVRKNKHTQKLCICFSAMPPLNSGPLYNYVNSTKKIKTHIFVFVLDDVINVKSGGGYYLGQNHNYFGLTDIPKFIGYLRTKFRPSEIVTMGTSKGGSCALLYGILSQVDRIIIGAPQFWLGSYLSEGFHIPSMKSLVSDHFTKDDVDELDSIIPNAIMNAKKKPVIFLHYSKNEHTFHDSVRDLLACLYKNSYIVHEDIHTYDNHSECGRFFIPYFIKSLSVRL